MAFLVLRPLDLDRNLHHRLPWVSSVQMRSWDVSASVVSQLLETNRNLAPPLCLYLYLYPAFYVALP